MKLVLIHGRDQQGKNPDTLKKAWIDTLNRGFAISGRSLDPSVEVIFPFYGDLLDNFVKQGQDMDMEKVIKRGASSSDAPLVGDPAFFNDFLMELAVNGGVTENQIKAHLIGPQQRGPLNWGWVQAILQTLDDTPIGNLSIRKFTFDVFCYLTINGIRKRINSFVTDKIGDGPCVVVGHSLGSIVGYEVLCSLGTGVNKYVTVGSPLGLTAVKRHLVKPLCMPQSITMQEWFNAYDERDVVALNPLDQNCFNIEPSIVNKRDVKNHTENRHGIEGYLDDEKVADTIWRALKSE